MANIMRKREERESAPLASGVDPSYRDPFQVMRSLFRWDPFREMESFLPSAGLRERNFVPNVELRETKDAYVIKADLPGVTEKDLDISVTGNQIAISGRREQEETREDERFYAYERSYGNFMRSFTLPEGADPDNVKADLKEGVLTLSVPKKPEVQPRKITIGGKEVEAKEGKKAA